MSLTALKTLANSSKFLVLVLVVALYIYALRYLTPEQVESLKEFLTVVVPGWMIAHAGERGAKHIANGRAIPAVLDTADEKASG